MPLPDYQTLMAPTLRCLADGEARASRDLRNAVAAVVGITDEDRRDTIPSGAPLFDSRVQWSITYLAQAGLVSRPKRGIVQITDRGRAVLREHPDRVDNTILSQFQDFIDFRNRARLHGEQTLLQNADATPPVETIANAVQVANSAVADEVLQRVQEHDPAFLERLVVRVLTAMGYGGPTGLPSISADREMRVWTA